MLHVLLGLNALLGVHGAAAALFRTVVYVRFVYHGLKADEVLQVLVLAAPVALVFLFFFYFPEYLLEFVGVHHLVYLLIQMVQVVVVGGVVHFRVRSLILWRCLEQVAHLVGGNCFAAAQAALVLRGCGVIRFALGRKEGPTIAFGSVHLLVCAEGVFAQGGFHLRLRSLAILQHVRRVLQLL